MENQTTQAHTPTPWTVSRHEDNDQVVIRDTAGAILANIEVDSFRDYGMTQNEHVLNLEANAQLIVTAVNNHFELLEALRLIANTTYRTNKVGKVDPIEIDHCIRIAKTAIQKATTK